MDVRPTPTPLPIAARETAPFFVLINAFQHPFEEKKATVYVKGGDYFREQGGLSADWGRNWIGIEAVSINDARLKAHASEGTACPAWHLMSEEEAVADLKATQPEIYALAKGPTKERGS